MAAPAGNLTEMRGSTWGMGILTNIGKNVRRLPSNPLFRPGRNFNEDNKTCYRDEVQKNPNLVGGFFSTMGACGAGEQERHHKVEPNIDTKPRNLRRPRSKLPHRSEYVQRKMRKYKHRRHSVASMGQNLKCILKNATSHITESLPVLQGRRAGRPR